MVLTSIIVTYGYIELKYETICLLKRIAFEIFLQKKQAKPLFVDSLVLYDLSDLGLTC